MTSSPKSDPKIAPYTGPAGGWGSAKSVTSILFREQIPIEGAALLRKQNMPDGYMCVSCAWAKLAKPHPLEFCENGAKATAWEVSRRRTTPEFFAQHTLTELESWLDYDLEREGRLTEPMKYDAASDRYLPIDWNSAFSEIGEALRAVDPKAVEFYASGRASLETAYMYQLYARIYGSNNLPDCSNMCHETSSVALPESIGAAVGTAVLSDFENTDCIFYIGQNVGTSSPRMLHDLQDAVDRGVKVVVFNPLRERGLERFIDPQSPSQMLTGSETEIASNYYQVKNGGDVAAFFGLSKALIEADDQLREAGATKVAGSDGVPAEDASAAEVAFAASIAAADDKHVLDHGFIRDHTAGFQEFAAAARAHQWPDLERVSGLTRAQMTEAARIYAGSKTVLLIYGMGLTQHTMGVDNVHMLVNLALLRGNIGKPGANICAVRGHSNVQGQRTVGITEKPGLVPLDKLAELYHFTPPRWEGHSTVDAFKAIARREVSAFISLGGNVLRAVPDTQPLEAAWREIPLTVNIATKLNRSHVIHGKVAFLLPCLGRIEIDEQASGPQAVSLESSVAHFHGSRGQVKPASPHLLSEPAIVGRLAIATLQGKGQVPWQEWIGDYALIRDAIERTYPETFTGFNAKFMQPGGFARPLPARERKWVTKSGKANFLTPSRLFPDFAYNVADPSVLQLMSLRSNDQYNTSIYGYDDRFRGVDGTRRVLFMNSRDIARLGLQDGGFARLRTAIEPECERLLDGLRIVAFDIPEGCCGAYYPECNVLFPLEHHDPNSKTPAYKLLPVSVTAAVNVRRGERG